mmetsp:Transcript_2034/g.6726  ORF Transcript_2034/g.6726 Transcript_2034/m.6726 type:complete len:369 (+) Transcript_2034:1337-2443(+)
MDKYRQRSRDTGADSLVRTILAAGIDTIFANPGTTEMPIVDALSRLSDLKVVLCVHETVCSGAADGYGRMLGRPACMLLHLGVGLANATANLHNAKRASTPMLAVVGDIATWHVDKDPLLASDIAGLAGFTSRFVKICDSSPDSVSFAVDEALTAVRDYKAGESRIATLIVPHDTQRNVLASPCTAPEALSSSYHEKHGPSHYEKRGTEEQSVFEISMGVHNSLFDGHNTIADQMHTCAKALLRLRGATAIMVGGSGLIKTSALSALAAIRSLSHCQLLVENAFARVERGTGRPDWHRVPYFPADARRLLCSFDAVILCGVRRPVAMFGYEDGISDTILSTTRCLQVDTVDIPGEARMSVTGVAIEIV